MAFTPANVPFDLWVGNHKTIIRGFSSTDDSGVTTPIDLSTYAVYFTVFNGTTKLLEKSTVAGSVTISGTSSQYATVALTPAETRTLAAATYAEGDGPRYEMEFRNAGNEETWLYGKIKLLGGKNVDA